MAFQIFHYGLITHTHTSLQKIYIYVYIYMIYILFIPHLAK